MRILHRQILKETLSHALLGLLLFTFVLFLRDTNRLIELLLRESAFARSIASLFLLSFPALLNFTVPVAILIGILITLSRMASEGEVVALRAAGMGVRSFLLPLGLFALLGCALALWLSVWAAPSANRMRVQIEREIGLRHISATVRPRVFEENLPNLVVYVQDVISGPNPAWRGVFLADVSNPAGPKITIAQEGMLMSDSAQNQLQLHLARGNIHEVSPDKNEYSVANFSETDIPIEMPPPPPTSVKPNAQRSTADLYNAPRSDPQWIEARIEFHRRIAIPLASIVFALAGIPLGLSSSRGGKSTGVVLAVLIVLIYYSLFIGGISLARQGWLPPWTGVWMANVFFAALGAFLIARVDAVTPWFGWITYLSELMESLKRRVSALFARKGGAAGAANRRLSTFPLILDSYITKLFLFYLVVTLAALIVLTEVVSFFVDLLNDVIRNEIPIGLVVDYFIHLTPQLIYVTTPLSVLLAILISFSLLTQRNEITAMKASGISLYRLSLPVFLISGLLSAGMFFFDHFYVPGSNQIQDAIRNRIKGRPAQTFYRPDRQWMFGKGSWIYYYKVFDPAERVLGGVTVFELDPQTFQLTRRISASRAVWEQSLGGWVFEDGWVRDLRNDNLQDYENFQVRLFPELREDPSYFRKEVKQSSQMNFIQLRAYLQDLKQSGFDVVPLTVQIHKKFSFPLFAFIMALIGMPFAFSVGKKGALTGIALSIGIAIVYWAVSSLFEALGNLNELSAVAAAWSPNLVFGLGGLYLFLRIET
ncbi:MAG: LPS export ABC transporter permease LptF [Acidobacteria bacterium]|nr:LPS export ABC transporter permease LptF [Acidobacteriota bacterium]